MWKYVQSTGELFHDGNHVGFGYSGKGAGKNNPDYQANGSDDSDGIWGPAPVGFYTIGEAFTSPKSGPLTMHLIPDPTNEMFHRGAFEMHGDSILHAGDASEGCLIQAHDVRVTVSRSPDRRLEIVARPVAAAA